MESVTYSTSSLLCFTLLLLLASSAIFTVWAEFHEEFETVLICGTLDGLVQNDCVSSPKQARNNAECAFMCSRDSSCLGSVLDNDHLCYFLHMCNYAWSNMNCNLDNKPNVAVLRKACKNGSKFTSVEGVVCKCIDGWIGNYCERRATSCKEVNGFGYRNGATYTVHINFRSQLVRMECSSFVNIYHSVTFFKTSGHHNKSFSWHEYRNGYYIDSDNFWLGLENMYELTKTYDPHRFLKGYFSFMRTDPKGTKYKVSDMFYYIAFRVRNESLGYSYFYSGISFTNAYTENKAEETTIGNCLENPGVPFSTWDNDHDLDPDNNCAQLAGAAWWFTTCNSTLTCNPLGMSVTTLPPPAQYSHIALKGLDMINSIFSDFRLLGFTLVQRYEAYTYSDRTKNKNIT